MWNDETRAELQKSLLGEISALGIDEHGSHLAYMRVVAHGSDVHLALRGLTRGADLSLILAAGATDYDKLFSCVQRVWGGRGRTRGRDRVRAGPCDDLQRV